MLSGPTRQRSRVAGGPTGIAGDPVRRAAEEAPVSDGPEDTARAERPPGGTRRLVTLGVYGVVAAVVIATAVFFSFQRGDKAPDIRSKATLVVPAGAGGGWDLVMREAQRAMRDNKIATNIQVLNIPGAAGTIGLARLASMDGRGDVVMVGGSGLVAGVQQTKSSVRVQDVTPIARIFEEYDVLVVPADSPYKTVQDLMDDWRKDPGGIAFTGGGSFDQLVMAQLAKAAGVDPKKTTYIPKSGGGEVAQALVTHTAKAALSGYADLSDQIASGRLRGLAIAAKQRLEGVDLPTLVESGYDVTLANWRALFGAPGITPEDVAAIRGMFDETLATPEWKDAMRRNQWTGVWMEGPDLTQFIADEDELIAGLYRELDQ